MQPRLRNACVHAACVWNANTTKNMLRSFILCIFLAALAFHKRIHRRIMYANLEVEGGSLVPLDPPLDPPLQVELDYDILFARQMLYHQATKAAQWLDQIQVLQDKGNQSNLT